MLILTRRKNETIEIAGRVKLKVTYLNSRDGDANIEVTVDGNPPDEHVLGWFNSGKKLINQFHIHEVDCTVKMLEVRGNQVRLGFTAPKDVNIVRSEINNRRRRTVH